MILRDFLSVTKADFFILDIEEKSDAKKLMVITHDYTIDNDYADYTVINIRIEHFENGLFKCGKYEEGYRIKIKDNM